MLSYNMALHKLKDDAMEVTSNLEKEFKSYNLILFDKYFSHWDDFKENEIDDIIVAMF